MEQVGDRMAKGKRRVREHYLRMRGELGEQYRLDADEGIGRGVLASAEYRAASLVFTYLSFGDEVDTKAIIRRAWADGKTVAAPRCTPDARLMRWYAICDFDHLERSRFGMDEPVADPACEIGVAASNTLALVPGLVFDRYGYRVGYGGGYYDAFLDGFGGVSVGLCRRAQFVESLAALDAVDVHDRRVDMVVVG